RVRHRDAVRRPRRAALASALQHRQRAAALPGDRPARRVRREKVDYSRGRYFGRVESPSHPMASRPWMFVLCLSVCARASAHPNSVSYANLSVDHGAIQAIVRLPLDDVDLLMRLDRDLDGRVSADELEASRMAIAGYFDQHLQLAVDGAPLRAILGRVAIWRDVAAFPYLEGDVLFAGSAAGQLSVRSDFLSELYPSHRTLVRIEVNGRVERFTFTGTSTYTARIGSNRPLVL